MEALTLAGVAGELNMFGTYLVNSCRGGWPDAVQECWNWPRMPVNGQQRNNGALYIKARGVCMCGVMVAVAVGE